MECISRLAYMVVTPLVPARNRSARKTYFRSKFKSLSNQSRAACLVVGGLVSGVLYKIRQYTDNSLMITYTILNNCLSNP